MKKTFKKKAFKRFGKVMESALFGWMSSKATEKEENMGCEGSKSANIQDQTDRNPTADGQDMNRNENANNTNNAHMGVLRQIIQSQSEVPTDEVTEKISKCENEVSSSPVNDLNRNVEAYCCTSPTENNNNSGIMCFPTSQENIHENNNAEFERREIRSPTKLITQNRGDSNDPILRSNQSYDISTLKETDYNRSKCIEVYNHLNLEGVRSDIIGNNEAIPSIVTVESKHKDNIPQMLTRAAEILETMKSGSCSVCNSNLCHENVDKGQIKFEKSRELPKDSSSDEEVTDSKKEETTAIKEVSPVPPNEDTTCPTAPDGDTQVGEVKFETNDGEPNKESNNPAEGEENAVPPIEVIEKIEVTSEFAAAVEKSNQSLRDNEEPNVNGDEAGEKREEEVTPSDEVGKVESPEAEKSEEEKPEEAKPEEAKPEEGKPEEGNADDLSANISGFLM